MRLSLLYVGAPDMGRAQVAGSQKESGYVFEVLPDGSLAVRRDDMRKVEALDALTTLMTVYFRIECFAQDVEELLTQAPQDWRYVRIGLVREGENVGLRLKPMDREPGKGSGDNPVITHIKSTPQYRH
jgi:hypothetical protein